MALNLIKGFNFVSMSAPEGLERQTIVRSRTGVDGHDIWRTGTRGLAFTIRTFRDFDTLTQAWETYLNGYLGITSEVVDILWENQQQQIRALIRRVRPVKPGGIRAQVISCGGLSTAGRAAAEMIWECVALSEEISMGTSIVRTASTKAVEWNASDTSDVVDLTGAAGAHLWLPAGFLGTTLEIEGSIPGSSPETFDKIYVAGVQLMMESVQPGFNLVPQELFGNFRRVRFKSNGAAQTATAQIALNT